MNYARSFSIFVLFVSLIAVVCVSYPDFVSFNHRHRDVRLSRLDRNAHHHVGYMCRVCVSTAALNQLGSSTDSASPINLPKSRKPHINVSWYWNTPSPHEVARIIVEWERQREIERKKAKSDGRSHSIDRPWNILHSCCICVPYQCM